jgi:hypothetical protein
MSIGEQEGATEINNLLKFESLIKKYHSLNSKVIIFMYLNSPEYN